MMKKILAGVVAAFIATAAYGQNTGTVTNHAYAIGKGPGVTGYTSLLCGSAQLAVGQAAADPICRTVTGDWTLNAAGLATLGTVNANVGTFGSATQCVSVTYNAKGLATAASAVTCTPAVGSITGFGAGVAAALAVAVNASGGIPTPTPVRAGDIIYWNGSAWATLAGNNSGTQVLSENASGVPSWSAAAAGSTALNEPQGRLTLQANTPVMSTSQANQATLRYDCYTGGNVPYFNGTSDAIDTIAACEVTDAMVSAATAGQVVTGNVYDVWWVNSGANRICLAMSAAAGGGGGWSSDTTGTNTARGTGYSQLDRITRPYTTNKNSITNCFNGATNYGPISVNRGTYLGTIATTANGQTSWQYGGTAVGGTGGFFGVWNMYNRVTVNSSCGDTTTQWNWATSNTWRAANASTQMRFTFVRGADEDGVTSDYTGAGSVAAVVAAIGVGLDSTVAFSGATAFTAQTVGTPLIAKYSGSPGVGLHFTQAIEFSAGGATATFYGNVAAYSQTGFHINTRM